MLRLYFLFIAAFFLSGEVFAQDKSNGIIRGKIIDHETQNPVQGAVIELINTGIVKYSDRNGEFRIDNLKFDSYQIKFSSLGYETQIKSDLLVYASKPLEIVVSLLPKAILTEQIDIKANYFTQSPDINLSLTNLDYEEIRRAPGATEDISRMLQTAPGISIGNDQRNDLIIRGGSPSENLIMIDGIEIPNINHFGTDGSSSGAIGFINSKFIRETNILTGGFPSIYGDKLSGVIDISFREGNKKKLYGDVNLSLSGFGGIFEGPISEKGSFLISVRRSYLELLRDAIRLSSVPNYWDFNIKTVYNVTPNDKLTLIGLLGLDKIEFSGESAENNPYGDSNVDQKTLGIGVNYQKIFKNGYIETVISDSYTDNFILQIDNETAFPKFENTAANNEIILKSSLNIRLSDYFTMNTGMGGKSANINNRIFLRGDTSAAGYAYDTINSDFRIKSFKLFSHVNLTSKLLGEKIILNTGFRVDYFDYIRLKTYFSPRIGISYKFSGITSLNAAYGIFYQTPEYIWLSSTPLNKNLNSVRSEHIIAGLEHFFYGDLRATAEVYYKRYKDYPVWKDVPNYILIDGGADFGPNIVGEALSAGTGYAYGIDFSVQKKLSSRNGLYGLINYSYIKTGFTALAGGEKPGAYDPGHQFTLITGYQFNNGWLVGLKFKYNGGRPYTPLDYEASAMVNREVYATNDFNSARYPYYMRVDLRVDKKIDFKSSSIVGYLELQNLFDRDNIYSYYWNENTGKPGTIYQWAFFPVGGISVQF